MSKDNAGVDIDVASSSFNINDENVGDDIAADNTFRKDDLVNARAGDGTTADFAVHIVTNGDDNACKGNNAAAVDVNTDGDFNGNDGNTADGIYGHKWICDERDNQNPTLKSTKYAIWWRVPLSKLLSSHNPRKFWQTTLEWEQWTLCHLFNDPTH